MWRSLLIDAQAFVQDSRYVLAPAATRQRLNALKQWNPAWSERYGGGWKLVVELLEASRRTGDPDVSCVSVGEGAPLPDRIVIDCQHASFRADLKERSGRDDERARRAV